MNTERLSKVLVAPIVSEKSTRLADSHRQVAFKVLRDADKAEIRRAVETMFEVEVDAVQVLNVKGKRKTFQRTEGRRPGWKKAYVTLKPGHDIEFLGGE